LKKAELESVPFIGVITDASNHLYIKVFPTIIQYFTIEEGLCVKLLDVTDLPCETSLIITQNLMSVLKKHGI
jgi:hypothetical protein